MKIEFLEEKGLKAVFVLSDSNISFANSLRRTMKNIVPTLAVDYVDFYMNTSYLYDEMLAHRIGLIPIKTDYGKFNMPEECSCDGEGCPSCQISLRLNIEGKKTVYSKDFMSDDPEITPVFDNIPVVELYEGQQIMIEAVARMGNGREHAKFQPVSVCGYRIIPKISIDPEKCTSCGECIKACAKRILKESGNGEITINNIKECTMCMECVKECEDDAIMVEETNDFIFTVESVGSLEVRSILIKALDILKEKSLEMNKVLEI